MINLKMNKIRLECESEIAYDSPDHINPHGTRRDSSRNKLFNNKIYALFKDIKSSFKVLDLGCSGGGFIRDCINDGCLAVGLEGSDYSKKNKRAEWATIPDNLFTCDISKDFSLFKDNNKILFDLITSWEVFEHIPEDRVNTLIENVKSHLSKDGLFIASVCSRSDKPDGVELHLTRKNKEWWIKKFEKHGFFEKKNAYKYFNGQYIRGRNQLDEDFHIALGLKNIDLEVPKEKLRYRLYDYWAGSRLQKRIKYLVLGEF